MLRRVAGCLNGLDEMYMYIVLLYSKFIGLKVGRRNVALRLEDSLYRMIFLKESTQFYNILI